MTRKQRHTLTLDPAIVETLGSDEAGLSATVNSVLAEEVDRRQRRAALIALLDKLDEADGPVDEAEIDSFRQLLTS